MNKLWIVEVNLMDIDGDLTNCFHVAEMDTSMRDNINLMMKIAEGLIKRKDQQTCKWVPVGYADNIEDAIKFVEMYRVLIDHEQRKRMRPV